MQPVLDRRVLGRRFLFERLCWGFYWVDVESFFTVVGSANDDLEFVAFNRCVYGAREFLECLLNGHGPENIVEVGLIMRLHCLELRVHPVEEPRSPTFRDIDAQSCGHSWPVYSNDARIVCCITCC